MPDTFIRRASFVVPIAPPGDVNNTQQYVSSNDAYLTLDGNCLRIAWAKDRALGGYSLVPLANVRELVVDAVPDVPAPKPSTPAQQPQQGPKAKAR